MTGIENSLELARHVNPEYWDGHSIGFGEAEVMPAPTTPALGTVSVKNQLERGLQGINGSGPLEVLETGKIFDAEEVPPGTVVAFCEESLSAGPDIPPLDIDHFRNLPLPERPMVTPADQTEQEAISAEGIDYTVALRWGIVAPNGSRGQVLHAISSRVVNRNNGSSRVSGLPTPQKAQTEIGKTRHYKSRSGAEKLARVNLLEIMAYGGQNGNGNGSAPYLARIMAAQN